MWVLSCLLNSSETCLSHLKSGHKNTFGVPLGIKSNMECKICGPWLAHHSGWLAATSGRAGIRDNNTPVLPDLGPRECICFAHVYTIKAEHSSGLLVVCCGFHSNRALHQSRAGVGKPMAPGPNRAHCLFL